MSRYKVNKIGFVNFWLYDEEEFYFCDGKLLLRGTNGSGKTVTMQSFFPLIFDGNKSPERLDPFGSRDRKIEDYLISEDFTGNENTGYLYMEFYNKDEDKYLTIGIGLRAIRNRNCEFWGFALTDGRRIGSDFLLFKERNLRVPLTKKELQIRVGTGGEFVETQKEYKKMVNKLLFGFPNIDLYTEFINLLIQVRSPKLSNATKPSQLTKVLSTVLEPLSEDDLRVMADSIEDMNKYKETLSDLQNEQKACNNLKISYQDYNRAVLHSKGEKYLQYKQELNAIENTKKMKNEEKENLIIQRDTEIGNRKKLELEEQELEHRKRQLEESDLKNITTRLDEIIDIIKDLENQQSSKENEKEQKTNLLSKNKKELKAKEDELYIIEKEIGELINDLTSYEDGINFDDAKFYLDDLKMKRLEFTDMSSFLKTVKRQVELLSVLKDKSYNIYIKEQEIEQEKSKYDQYNDKIKTIQKSQVETSNNLIIECNKFKDGISKTSIDNTVLKIEQENLNNIYQIIDSLNKDMFPKIKDIIKEQSYIYKDNINNTISLNKGKISEYNLKLENLKSDLNEIDNILTKNLDDTNIKKYFGDNNIKYNYLYELIDFKDNIDINLKKKIESFLLETGLLTSFITEIEIKDINIKARCLKEDKRTHNNLTKYIVALNTPFKEKVVKILESISIDNSDISNVKLLDNGKYTFALLDGVVDNQHELRYIGQKIREEYIKIQKEKVNINIKQIEREIENINNENQKLKTNINNLNDEINNFNYPDVITQLFKELDKLNLDIEIINSSLEDVTEIIRSKTSELRVLQEDFDSSKKGYYGSTKYQDIKETLDNTNSYLEVLKYLSNAFEQYQVKEELVINYKNNLESINLDLDNINIELDNIEFKLETSKNKKKTIDDILNSDKYKDVGKEYSKIKERLLIIKEELPKKIAIISRNEANIEVIEKEIANLDEKVNNIDILKKVAYKIFIDEYKLGYIQNSEIKENEIYHFVKGLKKDSRLSLIDYYDKFNDASNKYLSFLLDYASKYTTLHTPRENEYLDFTNDNSMKNDINVLLEEAKRRDLVFNYKGRTVNLLELSSIIDKSITTYQDLISDENRRLFEDLLINNIGSSIRTKINSSEEWIKEVKELMESMNTSSGLSFSLKWVGINALTEDEIDTKEIVNIFKKDPKILKEEDLKKITNHFRSKIQIREEALEESERNYLEIIKDVLDYRKWFEFKLYFKRGEKEKRELTDRDFNKMSGGEKAIAMYIPLFSSIYAKLNSALSYAPHIIALDEAFAGVDDDNIKDAFRILDKLDIDYVLTSQQLWGDYETIKHLAISELHHPVGSKVVSILKYKWDGIVRKHITNDDEYAI